VTSSKSGTWN